MIRPPGSVAEDEFLRRCIKCDQCIRVCPTNVLQPAMFEAGLEGLWTPIMISKMGWCELNCTLCSQVCPTGAIREISSPRSSAPGRSRPTGRSRRARVLQPGSLPALGDGHLMRGLRGGLPGEPEGDLHPERRGHRPLGRDPGAEAAIHRPRPLHRLRICEHECPVKDDPAVYVTAIGETRDKSRSLLLSLVDDQGQDWNSV